MEILWVVVFSCSLLEVLEFLERNFIKFMKVLLHMIINLCNYKYRRMWRQDK